MYGKTNQNAKGKYQIDVKTTFLILINSNLVCAKYTQVSKSHRMRQKFDMAMTVTCIVRACLDASLSCIYAIINTQCAFLSKFCRENNSKSGKRYTKAKHGSLWPV